MITTEKSVSRSHLSFRKNFLDDVKVLKKNKSVYLMTREFIKVLKYERFL